jgi:hypothetical protein
MATWPTTLPYKQLLDGLVYAPADQAIRSKPDTGPMKSRRRFSTGVAEVMVPVLFTGTELAAFDVYYETTLAGGTEAFTWADPAIGGAVTFKFVERPAFTPIRPDGSVGKRLWRSVLRLERQT